ncbi:hypothetical protein RI367_005143 [Sorochytrium milnesiophthora]
MSLGTVDSSMSSQGHAPYLVDSLPTPSNAATARRCRRPWYWFSRYRMSWRAIAASLFVFLAGLALALVLFFWIRSSEISRFKRVQTAQCRDRSNFLRYQFNRTVLQHLSSWNGYTKVSANMTNDSARRFGDASSFDPALFNAINIMTVVQNAQVSQWQQRFGLTLRVNSSMPDVGFHVPITFVYSGRGQTPNSTALGVDLLSEQNRREAALAAINTGSPAISRPLRLFSGQNGLVLWFPPITTQESAFSTRMVGGVLSVVDFFNNVLSSFNGNPTVFVSIYQQVPDWVLLYHQDGNGLELRPDDAIITPFTMADTNFQFKCIPTQDLYDRSRTAWGTVMLLVVTLLFAGIAAFVYRTVWRYDIARKDRKLLRKSRQMLKSLTEYSKTVVEAVPDPLVMVDSVGYITGFNKRALDQTGYSAETVALRRMHIRDLLQFGDDNRELVTGTWEVTVLKSDGSRFPARCSVSPLGTSRTANAVARVLLFADISEKMHVRVALERAEKEAKRANKLKSKLLYFFSHELRNPIHVIRGASHLLMDRLSSQAQQSTLHPIIHASNHMVSLLSDLAEYVEGDAAIMSAISSSLHPAVQTGSSTRILQVLHNAATHVPLAAVEKGLSVTVTDGCERALSSYEVTASGELFAKMVLKLVDVGCRAASSNAQLLLNLEAPGECGSLLDHATTDSAQAYPSAAPSLTSRSPTSSAAVQAPTQTNHSTQRRSGRLMRLKLTMTVTESNVAIPHDVEIFSFKYSSLGQGFGGIGISSALLRKYVSQLGGSMYVRDGAVASTGNIEHQRVDVVVNLAVRDIDPADVVKEEAAGGEALTVIPLPSDVAEPSLEPDHLAPAIAIPPAAEVTLTSEVGNDMSPPQQQQQHFSEMPPLIAHQILLAEDNMIVQRMTKKLLEKHGYVVTTADNGQQAVERVEQGHFDAVLMDLIMPVKDGFEATEYIRTKLHKSPQRLPVIALTANALEEERQRCMSSGFFNDFITKPATAAFLHATLQKYITGAPSANAASSAQ